MTEPAPSVRNSERSMEASCPFADRVAQCALDAFHRRCPQQLQSSFKQTVLAAFVLCDDRPTSTSSCSCAAEKVATLECLCFGVGTKFLPAELFRATTTPIAEVADDDDKQHMNENNRCVPASDVLVVGGRTDVVRDLHAEALARRALQLVLLQQIQHLTTTKKIGGGKRSFLEEETTTAGDGNKVFHLASGCSLHFYTSSQPCGNASVKRWGSGASSRQKKREDKPTTTSFDEKDEEADGGVVPSASSSSSSPNRRQRVATWKSEQQEKEKDAPCSCSWSTTQQQYNFEDHPPLHVVQRDAGQVALLAKRFSENNNQETEQHHRDNNSSSSSSSAPRDLFPPRGTQVAVPTEQQIPCCSGKIAAWNAVGWEGALLQSGAGFSTAGIFPRSIVVGRKFSALHAQRGLCCRVDLTRQQLSKQDRKMARDFFGGDTSASSPSSLLAPSSSKTQKVHHPVLMSTSKKLDHSVRVVLVQQNEDGGESDVGAANFAETRCFCWMTTTTDVSSEEDDGYGEVICGKSGRPVVLSNEEEKRKTAKDPERPELLSVSRFSLAGFLEQVGGESKTVKIAAEALLRAFHPHHHAASPNGTDDESSERFKAVSTLVNHPLLFRNWPRCDAFETFL